MGWISQLASIKVNFEHLGKCNLPLFQRNGEESGQASRAAIIYGKNGAGKSSLAKALRSPSRDFQAFDAKGAEIELQNSEDIYVFDQDYIDRNLRQHDSEGLNPIVLLGDQVDHQTEIDGLEQEIGQKENTLENIESKLKKAEQNLEQKRQAFNEILRGKSNTDRQSWASRASAIHNKQKKVTDKVKQQILERTEITDDWQDIHSEFVRVKTMLKQTESQNHDGFRKPSSVPSIEFHEVSQILETIDKRRDSAPEDDLTRRIEESRGGLTEIRNKIDNLFGPESEYCPHCYQDIPQSHKDKVLPLLGKIVEQIELDAEVRRLANFKATWSAEFSMPLVAEIPDSLREKASRAIRILEEERDTFNNSLNRKIDNPKLEIELRFQKFDKKVNEWNSVIDEVDGYVQKHNSAIEDREELIQKAEDLNVRLARLEARAEIEAYVSAKNKYQKKRDNFKSLESDIGTLKEKVNSLKRINAGESTGADQANQLLKVVFGPNGIQLEPTDHGYMVVNRDRTMSPGKLSTGESNAVGLCYFFVKLAEEETFEKGLGKSRLIVLDDPISSFDFDNRYGVTALIGFMAKQILESKNGSKLVFLTHDPSVAYDFSKILNVHLSGNELSWEFSEGQLLPGNFAATDVYKEILERMFKTFDDPTACEKLTSNEVRRVWEAFVTFELGETTTDASTSAKVQKYFEEMGEKHQRFLAQYPSRVFINPDSHAAKQIAYFNFGLSPSLDSNEFQRFIRDTLCFMHMLSPYHIASRIAQNVSERKGIKKRLNLESEKLLEI
ncbi:AAA family ATPase [uncultured Corynebacterium sp.]|uniref:AAA family ATPase n=1 Tax=uncultured Corynebacterium sp. TaxID=159447 RepID=UPI002598291E|nr:AAA family ATPase [uncultured Corynebacterium sp.]